MIFVGEHKKLVCSDGDAMSEAARPGQNFLCAGKIQSMPNKLRTHLPSFAALLLILFGWFCRLFLLLRLGRLQRRRPGH